MVDFRNIVAVAQQKPSIPGLLAMLRGGDLQGVGGGGGGGGISQAVGVGPGAGPGSSRGGGAGAGSSGRFGDYFGGPVSAPAPAPVNDQYGWLNATIAAPPEGWKSQSDIYEKAGFGNGWLTGNWMENPDAVARTKAGPQMPYGIDPFTDIEYGAGSGQEGQQSGFHLVNRGEGAGPDLFGGHQFPAGNIPRDIPEQLQPWLAPALMRHFYANAYSSQGGSGMNAPWTRRYAPIVNLGTGAEGSTWPGITQYDPWHRPIGEYPALYS